MHRHYTTIECQHSKGKKSWTIVEHTFNDQYSISTDQLSALISPLLDSCPWFRFELLKFSQFFLLYTDCCAVSDWTRRISKEDWLRCAVVKKTSTVTWLCSRYYAKNPVTGFSSCAPCMRLRVLVQCHSWESLRVQRQKGGTGFLS